MIYNEKESSTLEFKEMIPENKQIIKTIIGFCNLYGGRLIIGINDNRQITGIEEEKIEQIMEYLNQSIYESCTPVIVPHIYSRRIDNQLILIIEVSEGMNKPYFISSKGLNHGTYVRVGRITLKALPEIIQELQWQSRGKSPDELPVYHADEHVVDLDLIALFLKTRQSGFQGIINNDLLKSYKITVSEHSRNYPTTGAVLLFTKDPQFFFPEAYIVCTEFVGNSGREAIASLDCTGSLFSQFESAYNFIVSRLSKSFSIKNTKREETIEIPVIAIREILLNAIVHRNYNIKGSIKIAIYNNRIEFFSPGLFPGPLSIDNLEEGITYIRNSVICKIFREAGYIEKMGTGFITMFASYAKANLKKPQIIEGQNFIKCILPREKDLNTSNSDPIIDLCLKFDDISISDVIKTLNITRATAGRRLRKLVDSGLIIKHGKGPASRYSIA
jgi:ATP-dependent DNA helicase RecG